LTTTLADGTVVGHAEFGDPAGRPLLFFHGWPGSRLQARIIDGPARKYGLRVLAPDRPGIGLSSPAPCARVAAWIPTLRAWTDQLNLAGFYVLGVSGGGPYSLACAALMPRRIASAGVCCGVPPPRWLEESRDLFWLYRLLRRIDRGAPRLLVRLMNVTRLYLTVLPSPWSLRPFCLLMPRADRRALQRRGRMHLVVASTREAYAGGVPAVIADARRLQQPWGFDPGAIADPVYFWHGCQDRNIPLSLVRPFIDSLKQARAHYFAAEGHYSLPFGRTPEILERLTSDRPESF
jgi:pimeloyl-ACP methyl ester carboxylesterase